MNDKKDQKRELKPRLRFPKYRKAGAWQTEPLRELATLTNERVGERSCTPLSVTSGVGLVTQEEKFGRTIAGKQYRSYLVLQRGDFAFNKSATKEYPQGFIANYLGDELAAVPNSIFTCFRVQKETLDPAYLNYLFINNLHGKWLSKYITVGARAHGSLNINDEDILSLPIPKPDGDLSIAEQQEIANFLSSIDEVIAAEVRKLVSLKAYKIGLMQQLFPAEGGTVPHLRFPDFRGDKAWSKVRLGDIAKPVSDKTGANDNNNVLTLSGEHGLILQSEYFGKKIAGDNVERYIRILCNDFVYNDRTTKLSTYGSIKRLCKYGNGIVSPIYKCFRFDFDENPVFWEWYFESGSHEAELHGLINEGARTGRFNISIERFLSTHVLRPERCEQNKLADCLSSITELIAAQGQKIDIIKAHKKALMQQLFPVMDEVKE